MVRAAAARVARLQHALSAECGGAGEVILTLDRGTVFHVRFSDGCVLRVQFACLRYAGPSDVFGVVAADSAAMTLNTGDSARLTVAPPPPPPPTPAPPPPVYGGLPSSLAQGARATAPHASATSRPVSSTVYERPAHMYSKGGHAVQHLLVTVDSDGRHVATVHTGPVPEGTVVMPAEIRQRVVATMATRGLPASHNSSTAAAAAPDAAAVASAAAQPAAAVAPSATGEPGAAGGGAGSGAEVPPSQLAQ